MIIKRRISPLAKKNVQICPCKLQKKFEIWDCQLSNNDTFSLDRGGYFRHWNALDRPVLAHFLSRFHCLQGIYYLVNYKACENFVLLFMVCVFYGYVRVGREWSIQNGMLARSRVFIARDIICFRFFVKEHIAMDFIYPSLFRGQNICFTFIFWFWFYSHGHFC